MIKKIILYIWQFPQNLLGLLLILIYTKRPFNKNNLIRKIKYKDKNVYILESFRGGISLGNYILVDFYRKEFYSDLVRMSLSNSVKHEYGHCIQSQRWGWLYLPVVGVASLCEVFFDKDGNYYDDWPESEADRLGGVER
jgi:hypothetical protein